jgi:hypothetical protein
MRPDELGLACELLMNSHRDILEFDRDEPFVAPRPVDRLEVYLELYPQHLQHYQELLLQVGQARRCFQTACVSAPTPQHGLAKELHNLVATQLANSNNSWDPNLPFLCQVYALEFVQQVLEYASLVAELSEISAPQLSVDQVTFAISSVYRHEPNRLWKAYGWLGLLWDGRVPDSSSVEDSLDSDDDPLDSGDDRSDSPSQAPKRQRLDGDGDEIPADVSVASPKFISQESIDLLTSVAGSNALRPSPAASQCLVACAEMYLVNLLALSTKVASADRPLTSRDVAFTHQRFSGLQRV